MSNMRYWMLGAFAFVAAVTLLLGACSARQHDKEVTLAEPATLQSLRGEDMARHLLDIDPLLVIDSGSPDSDVVSL